MYILSIITIIVLALYTYVAYILPYKHLKEEDTPKSDFWILYFALVTWLNIFIGLGVSTLCFLIINIFHL